MKIPGAENSVLVKAKAKLSKHLSADDFSTLLSFTTTNEITDYLKNRTCYSSVMSSYSASAPYRGQFTALLAVNRLDELVEISRYEKQGADNACKYLFFKRDCEQVLRRFRTLGEEIDEFYRNILPEEYKSFSKIDSAEMAGFTTSEEMLSFFSETEFEPVVAAAAGKETGILEAEAVISKLCREKLQTIIANASPGKQRKELRETVGMLTDSEALLSLYRLKRTGESNEGVQRLFLDDSVSNLSAKTIDAIINEPDPSAFFNILHGTPYEKIFAPDSHPSVRVNSVCSNHCRKRIRATTNADEAVLCFYYILQYEINDISNIFEGARCSAGPEIIKQFIYSYTL